MTVLTVSSGGYGQCLRGSSKETPQGRVLTYTPAESYRQQDYPSNWQQSQPKHRRRANNNSYPNNAFSVTWFTSDLILIMPEAVANTCSHSLLPLNSILRSLSLVLWSLPDDVLTTLLRLFSCETGGFGTLPSRVELDTFLKCTLVLFPFSFFLNSTCRVMLLRSKWLFSLDEESRLSCSLLLMSLWAYLTYYFDF